MSQKTSPQKISRLPSASAAARWQAVVNRDATVDTFVYAVLTTKIYCRVSCPSRLARRANVRFYDTPSQAEAAGFRPCKRCKPETLWALSPHVQLTQKACETIESEIRAGFKPTLQKLAGQAGLTPSHFHRVFKKVLGVTPGQYTTAALNHHNQSLLDGYDGDENRLVIQPCELDMHRDPCFLGVLDDPDCPDTSDAGLWNDFDDLIAAEAEYFLREDVVLPIDKLSPLPMIDVPDATNITVTSEDTLAGVLSQEGQTISSLSQLEMDQPQLIV